jgi:hypothetical protein
MCSRWDTPGHILDICTIHVWAPHVYSTDEIHLDIFSTPHPPISYDRISGTYCMWPCVGLRASVDMWRRKKKSLLPPGIPHPSSSPVTILTELPNLLMYNINGFTNSHISIVPECQCPTARVLMSVPLQMCSTLCCIAIYQWFPKWAVPPPGGRWDYRGGR